MKGLMIVGLGIAIWGLSLLWPEVNKALTPMAMLGLGLGISLVHLWQEHRSQRHRNDGAGPVRPHWPNHQSRPYFIRHLS